MQPTTNLLVASALASCLFAAGCDIRPKGAGKGASTTANVLAGRTIQQVADDYLKDLSAGKVTASGLTPELKKLITRPMTDDEKRAGFSDEQSRAFLRQFEQVQWVIGDVFTFGPYIVARGRAESATGKRAFSLRLLNAGDAFLVDWIHMTERVGRAGPYPADVELALAQDTVRNFLDLLQSPEPRLAHALMSPEYRTKLAPPTEPDQKKGYDYDPGFLTQTTRFWVRDAVNYVLTKAEWDANKQSTTFVAEFESGGKTTPHTITAKKVGDAWRIVSFSN